LISVVQRVSSANVRVAGEIVGRIDRGLVALVCAMRGDDDTDLENTARKLLTLRIFGDEQGRMNRSLTDVGGAILVVSQFTLAADTRKGRRPSFTDAAPPQEGESMIAQLVERLRSDDVRVETGVFGAHMEVELVNDGPVTIVLDSRRPRADSGRIAGGEV
jgi:D-tyrosyl-tRNA(Tyr) deacylase